MPFTFWLVAGGQRDAFPSNTGIVIAFDAAFLDLQTGEPSTNPNDIYSGGDSAQFATDISLLNAAHWDFFRFKVEFDLDSAAGGLTPTAPRPGLDDLRVPYRF